MAAQARNEIGLGETDEEIGPFLLIGGIAPGILGAKTNPVSRSEEPPPGGSAETGRKRDPAELPRKR